MKPCVKCGKDIPDSAMHCVFCGAKLAGAAPPAQTILGYAGMAEEVLAAANAAKAKQRADEESARQAAQPMPPAAQPAHQSAPAPQPAPAQSAPAQPQYAAPGPAPAQPQYAAPQPAPAQPQYAAPGPAPAHAQAQPAHGQPPQPSQPQSHPHPSTPQPAPGMPPYLASQTEQRMHQPFEPWSKSLRTLCIVAGALLLLAFVLPWRIGEGRTTFSWNMLDQGKTAVKLLPILIALSGLGGLIIGLIQLGTTVRGIIAAGLGLLPILTMAAGGYVPGTPVVSGEFDWRSLALLLGIAIVAAALLLRAQYPAAMLVRIIASVGIGILVLAYVVPGEHSSLLKELIDAVDRARHATMKIRAVLLFLPLVVGLLSLLVWLPASSGAGLGVLAWIAIVLLGVLVPISALLVVIETSRAGGELAKNLSIWYHMPAVLISLYGLTAYGVATVVGKQLEPR